MKTISEYAPFLKALLQTITDQFSFASEPDFSKVCSSPRNIILINHSTPLSWIPAMTLLSVEAERHGGGHRKPLGVMDKFFYSNPLTLPLAKYFSQADRPLKFLDLVEHVKNASDIDLVLFPEGALSFFGDSAQIHNFRSDRFVELAVLTGAPIVMVVHKGSEDWAIDFKFPLVAASFVSQLLAPVSPFFAENILKSQHLNVPWPFKKMKNFSMKCEIYDLKLTPQDLQVDREQKRILIEREAQKVRDRMKQILLTLE